VKDQDRALSKRPILITLAPGSARRASTSLFVKLLTSTLDKIIATAVPIGRRGIYMIQCSLAEVKIRRRARWWFSTSQSGGFRPDEAWERIRKRQEKQTYHGDTEARRKPEEIIGCLDARVTQPPSAVAFLFIAK
jgi:hypothetical protein